MKKLWLLLIILHLIKFHTDTAPFIKMKITTNSESSSLSFEDNKSKQDAVAENSIKKEEHKENQFTCIQPETNATIIEEKSAKSTEQYKKPNFNIDYWISFAKNYAVLVGLNLNSEAIYCWDNPIAAGFNCKYTERDIKDCLNHYSKDKEITDVWIWSEKTDSTYEIYVGYA